MTMTITAATATNVAIAGGDGRRIRSIVPETGAQQAAPGRPGRPGAGQRRGDGRVGPVRARGRSGHGVGPGTGSFQCRTPPTERIASRLNMAWAKIPGPRRPSL